MSIVELSFAAFALVGFLGIIGGIETINYSYKQVFEKGHNRLHPLTIPKIMNNSATSLISIEYKIQGPSFTISSNLPFKFS